MPDSPLSTELSQTSFYGFGTAAFRQGENASQTEKEYFSVLDTAIGHGCRHIDTAAAYSNGYSETVIGKFLKRRNGVRENLIVASKGGMKGKSLNFLKTLDGSRRRLNCGVIDIYYIHWPVQGLDPRYSLDALFEAKEKGWIRYTGLSNFSLKELQAASVHCPIDICQFAYNLIWRQAEEELIPFCRSKGIITAGYAPLAQGVLSGSQMRGTTLPEEDHRRLTLFYNPAYSECISTILNALKKVERKSGIPLKLAAREWLKSAGQVDTAVIGASSRKQADENFLPQPELSQTVLASFQEAAEKSTNCLKGQESIYLSRP